MRPSLFLVSFLLCILLPVQIYCQVTCGSVVKLKHKVTGARLHSHQVNYATGSGQQSVTCFPSAGDSNSYWLIKGKYNPNDPEFECKPGTILKHGDSIRLQHVNTNGHLHSHLHQSPLSHQQEVSCYQGTDTGDNWKLEILDSSSKEWKVGQPIRLQHIDTQQFLHSHKGHRYGHPIPNQFEVTAFAVANNEDNIWTAEEGIYRTE